MNLKLSRSQFISLIMKLLSRPASVEFGSSAFLVHQPRSAAIPYRTCQSQSDMFALKTSSQQLSYHRVCTLSFAPLSSHQRMKQRYLPFCIVGRPVWFRSKWQTWLERSRLHSVIKREKKCKLSRPPTHASQKHLMQSLTHLKRRENLRSQDWWVEGGYLPRTLHRFNLFY